MSSNIANNTNYDYAHIMDLHKKINANPMNVSKADKEEYHATRKNNPELDQALYDQDKAEVLASMDKNKEILRKVARGEKLTKEEQDAVNNDADLKQKVEDLKQEKTDTENSLKNASPEQKKSILNAKMLEMASKDEYTEEDMANMEILQEMMHKYKDKDNEEENSKNEKFFAKNLHYNYEV